MRVIATLTTTPYRQNKQLKRTIAALQRNPRIDEIWLQLPKVFRRRPEVLYTPMDSVGKLKVHRVDDMGPATKLIGAACNPDLRDDDVLFITDDDVVVEPAAIDRLVAAIDRDPDFVYTQMGGVLAPDGKYSEGIISTNDGVGSIVDYFVASTGAAVRGQHVRNKGDSLTEYAEACFRVCPTAILNDDLVLANWFAREGVDVVALDLKLDRPGGNSKLIDVTFCADDEHALIQGASGDADPAVPSDMRYGHVRDQLRTHGLWYGE